MNKVQLLQAKIRQYDTIIDRLDNLSTKTAELKDIARKLLNEAILEGQSK